jgi:hypothetical protein
MQSHRIPGKVNVDETGATFLKVDALTCGFGRNQETNRPRIEPISRGLSCLAKVSASTAGQKDSGQCIIAIDECGAITSL